MTTDIRVPLNENELALLKDATTCYLERLDDAEEMRDAIRVEHKLERWIHSLGKKLERAAKKDPQDA